MRGRGDEPLDATFEELIGRAPAHLRDAARALPYRLGITHRPSGGWGDFAKIEPICDLPLFALESVAPSVSDESVGRYRLAHRVGGFHGLLVDRVADGQARLDPELRALRTWLRAERVAALGLATGAPFVAERLVAQAERSFRAGTAIERRARAARRMDALEYRRMVEAKTRWLAVPTLAMLGHYASAESAAPFAAGYERFMLALQLLDDAVDTNEDRALFGVTMPELLGVTPDVLRHASRLVTAEARDALAASSFSRFASWCDERLQELASGASLLSALGAAALAGRLDRPAVRASRSVEPCAPPDPLLPEATCTA